MGGVVCKCMWDWDAYWIGGEEHDLPLECADGSELKTSLVLDRGATNEASP